MIYTGVPGSPTGLTRVTMSGDSSTTVSSSIQGFDIITNFTTTDPTPPPAPIQLENSIFFTVKANTSNARYIYRAALDGSATQLKQVDYEITGCAYSSTTDKLYLSSSNGNIYWMNADGSAYDQFNAAGLSYSGHNLRGIAIDDETQTMVLTDKTSGTIFTSNLTDSSQVSTRTTGQTSIEGISILKNPYESSPEIMWAVNGAIRVNKLSADGNTYLSEPTFAGQNVGVAQAPGLSSRFPYHIIAANDVGDVRIFFAAFSDGVAGFRLLDERYDISNVATFSTRQNPGFQTTYLIGTVGGIRVSADYLPHHDISYAFIDVGTSSLEALCTGHANDQFPANKTSTGSSAGTKIPGKVGSPGSGATSFAEATNTVLVYLKPKDSASSAVYAEAGTQATVTQLDTQVSTTDANGNYVFDNVPDGEYTISFERADRAFTVPSFDIDTADLNIEVPSTFAIPLDPPSNCSWTEKIAAVSKANTKAAALYAFAVKQADTVLSVAASQTSAVKTKLNTLVASTKVKFSTLYRAVLSATDEIPSVVLTCSAASGCKNTGYGSKIKTVNKKLAKLSATLDKFMSKAQKILGTKKDLKLSKIAKTNAKLLKAAGGATTSLPTNSASCVS